MTKPIAVFFHCLFYLGDPPTVRPSAVDVVSGQMQRLTRCGLRDAATEIVCGINGGQESHHIADMLLPAKARKVYHGLSSRAENLTIVEVENWVKTHPGWNVLYFHSKGATHIPGTPYAAFSARWGDTMMRYVVDNWRQCVSDLENGSGFDIACCHWMWNMADGTQHIPAGNFLWVTSDFAAKLPSIFLRERIKTSGIAAVESRYESEVYWGNGPRPNVKQYLPNGGEGCP
jgi:hypothetical protein